MLEPELGGANQGTQLFLNKGPIIQMAPDDQEKGQNRKTKLGGAAHRTKSGQNQLEGQGSRRYRGRHVGEI